MEGEDGVCPADKTCLYFGFSEQDQDSYSYEKCAHYLHTGASIDESHFSKREGWARALNRMMRELEEEFQCAGLFEMSPIYLFSNVNNGLPKTRCFEVLMDQSDKILDSFYSSAAANFSFLVIYLITSILILLYRIYASCSWCFKGKKKDGDEERRAGQRKKHHDTIDPGAIEFQVELEEQGQNGQENVPYNEVLDDQGTDAEGENPSKKNNNNKYQLEVEV